MVDNSSNTNALVAFFSNIAGGKDYWIFWVAVSFASWIGFYFRPNLILLLSGIATSTVVLITAFISAFRWAKAKRRHRLLYELEAKNKRNAEFAEAVRVTSLVWKYVAHSDETYLKIASAILSFEKHDNNDYIRFLKRPKQYSNDEDIYNGILSIVPYFCFHVDNFGNELHLLQSEHIREGCYIHINPYFHMLLQNYKDTGEWKKVPIE